MPKIKNMYGGAYKPIHKSQNRHNQGNGPSVKSPIHSGLVSFLAFSEAGKLKFTIISQIFVCLTVLMVSTNVWAAPVVTLTAERTEFSPNQDGVLDTVTLYYSISEAVDESELQFFLKTGETTLPFGQPVPLEQTQGGHTFQWDGGDQNFEVFPDGQYILKFQVEAGGTTYSVETNPITIDTQVPIISRVVANENLTLVDGIFINAPIQLIQGTADAAGGAPIDLTAPETSITAQTQQGVAIKGDLSYDQTSVTFVFGNRLDTASENGTYTVSIAVADRAGNVAQRTLDFTFDNVAPNLTAVATSNGRLIPGAGVSSTVDFVEATLSDNLQDGLSPSDSRIRLIGPDGVILGRQTQPNADTIRWVFLSPLLANDGLMDGVYTIEVIAADKAGNQTEALPIPFIYDNRAPLVTLSFDEASPFTLHQNTIYHAQPLAQIIATFDDAGGVGVNLQESTRISLATTGADGQLNLLSGREFLETERNQLTYILETPLTSRDGSQDGRYALNVQATDTLGNTKVYNYDLIYDTQLPALVSTTPTTNETVSNLSQVEVVLDDKTSGIDFIQSTFRLARDVDGNQVDVPVDVTRDGTNTATLTLAQPISLDGSDDGTYIIEITPTDLAGNLGVTVRRKFYLVSQTRPEIRLTTPETTIVNNLTTVVAELRGYIGAGIDFDASTLTVRDPQANLITQTELEHDAVNNLLIWNIKSIFPRDGSADGEYTITATFRDFVGQSFTREFSRILDTQFPGIESVQVATASRPELTTDSTTTVAEGLSQIIVTFENPFDSSGSSIDFANTGVTLTNPAGQGISVNRFDDGIKVLTLDFQALTQPGGYVLSIVPQDSAGNQSATPFVYRFRVDVPLPTVSSVLIGGKLGVIVYVNGDASDIVATFADLSGAGIDLDDGGSTIAVTSATGLPVPGITTSNGTDQLTWTPIVLPTNGSADGSYTVVITPKDKAGRQGDVTYRQFVYDTQEPRITASTPVSLIQPINYIGGTLNQFQFTVEDIGPAGLALDEQTIELFDAQGASVGAISTYDDLNSQLYLTLNAPFAQDGSADGEYVVKVSLVDQSGNKVSSEQRFVYDSQVPHVSSVSVNTESALELVPQQIAEIEESISSITVHFEEATRVDFANTVVSLLRPDGQPIPLNVSDDGLTKFTADFVALTQTGLYTLSVTPQDIAGNVAQGAVQYAFRLDFVLPSVSSVELGGQIGDVVFLNSSDTTITASLLDGTGAGLALGDGGSSIVVTGPSGAVVPGQTRSIETNQLVWQPISLPTDGSADGRYTVTITPVDRAGRQGDVVHREFIYDTQAPRITASTPVSLSQPITYISGTLTQFQFTVEDVGPAGLALDRQTAALLNSEGVSVRTTLTFDEVSSQLYLTLDTPLAQDESADGEYTVRLPLVDRSGNVLDLEHVFVYDSQVPRVSSVLINTESPVELVPQQIAEIAESVNSITVHFEEATRVDFTNTVVSLLRPDGQPIPLNVSDDGLTKFTADFVALTQTGLYTLSVTPQDIAGNVAQGAVQYAFRLDFVLPSVSSVELGGQIGDVVFLNGSNTTITASLLDGTGAGLALGDGGSTIAVTNATGLPVPGITTSNGTDQLTWTPIVLPTNGSADGSYTVVITPKDKAGRQGDVTYRQFVYDTQEPRITASTPVSLSQPITYISGTLTQFQFTVEDIGPAGLALDEQTIELFDAQGASVGAISTYDDLNSQLYLTLNAPFAQDGSADGEYVVKVSLVDQSENKVSSEQRFVYDSQVPRVSSVLINTESPVELLPQQITEIAESVNSITVHFEEATRVDFTNTVVSLLRPDGQPIPLNVSDDGLTKFTADFVALTQTGLYTLSVTPQDIAGNVAQGAVQYAFRLDFVLPSVSSVELGGQIGDVVFLNSSDTTITASLLDGTGAGLALGDGGSSIVVTGPSGAVVPGQTRSIETNQLVWQPISLPTDGSADGRYTVTITPVDRAGRQGDVVHREFIYDTQEPRITASTPVSLNQPITYISGTLTQFQFTVEDVGPAGLALDEQTIELLDAQGAFVSTISTYDDLNSQLYLTLDTPFAQDGSADGEYVVKVSLVDQSGNKVSSEQRFVYDSQVPHVSSVSVNTESALELVPQQIAEIEESISSITVHFEEATRVDFANTVVSLLRPDGQPIPLNVSDDGLTKFTADFVALTQTGLYTLSVTPQDIAGNVAQGAVQYAFRLDFVLPSVSSVELGGQIGDVVFLNSSDTTITASLLDGTGAGLALGDGGSSIVVTGPSGAVVPGQTRSIETNQLVWQPISLPTDGSADGRYTVTITPVDRAGRQGDVVHREFIYDTQEPRITASTPVSLIQPPNYIGGTLNQFQFTVEDIGPAGLALDEQTIELFDAQGASVGAISTYDDLNSQLYLTLNAPFAQDGSADGEYVVKVSLVDQSGNKVSSEQRFVYDSQVPHVSSVSVNTESALELVPQQIAEIEESISSITVHFEEATRVDFANTVVSLLRPDGQPIPLNVSDDGLTKFTADFVALTQTGLYTLSVTPQDIAGNVAQGAVQYAFRLDFVLPSVSSVELGGQIGDVVFLNSSDTTITASLLDGTGAGLALGDGGSSIVVTGPSGAVVPGQTRSIETNQLVWQPISLPTDGSADGRYTVAITPVDRAGRQGDVVHREFIYDTEVPRITASAPLMLSQPISYIRDGLGQFSFTVVDVGPADLLLESQTIALIDSVGGTVPATLTFDELTNQFYLTLTTPFARDGSVDGAYTMQLSLVDRAGNMLNVEHTLVYDSQTPQLALVTANTETPLELIAQDTVEISEPISSITMHFEEATRVDFANTLVTLVSSGISATTGNPEIVGIPITLQDDGISQMTVRFSELNQLDTYVLSVTPQDIAGNVAPAPINYTFILDIPLPIVSSVIIGDIETAAGGDVVYINAGNRIIGAVLEDPTETGLDLSSDGSDITVADANNTIVPGITGSNGVDLLIWEPITLTTDGTTDGRYSVYVTPVDKAGREGNTVYREFIYDTQEPEIIAADPIDLSQPVSYISESLTQFYLTVTDIGPADLVLSDQSVSLRDTNGNLVPARLTNDTENQLFLTLDQPLPRDGSMDGEYTIVVALADKAGNALNIEHSIVYDTQAPTLLSTTPADGAHLTEDITQIQVTLNDEGGSGIDWSRTTITLVNPSGQQITGELVSNGTTTLTLTTNQLVEDGRYVVGVQAADRAGNGGVTAFQRSFVLSRSLPVIISTEPRTAPADEAFTNEEIEQIEVNLETDDANHLSTLRLLNPENQVIAGQQERASGRLMYNLVRPLATDGSEDGVYTIEFTPISASGRSGEIQRLTFTYDTQAPEIENDEAIQFVVAAPAGNNSLTEIRVTLTDDTSGIDWKNLDEKWITFERLSPNPVKVSGRVSDDEQSTLAFQLTVPLADNGSADGEYRITVNPVDRAGNDDEPYERVFVYDTSPPMIDVNALLLNEAPLLVDVNAENYPTALSTTGGVVIQASIFDTGLGVNLAQSQITLRGPDGSEVPGNTQQNGVDTIVFKSAGLAMQGHYQVTVTSVGNDSEHLGFTPTDSITTQFLYETSEPTAAVTSDGGETELTDEPIRFEGTASDPEGTQRIGEGQITVPPSGIWLVEIVGTGPDGQPIDPVPAVDDSGAQEEPWSRWSLDFLPSRSGEYELDVRVTDNAGNYAVYDIGTYTMSVSLTFRGSTFGWPNPLRLSNRDVAFFSYDVNVPLGETIDLTLSIYDWSGDMVRTETYSNVVSGQRNDQLVKWNLENQAGTPVARGLYIFRLEAVNAAGNSANAVGKVLVVD